MTKRSMVRARTAAPPIVGPARGQWPTHGWSRPASPASTRATTAFAGSGRAFPPESWEDWWSLGQSSPAAAEREVLGLPAFSRGKNLIGGIVAQMELVDRHADGTPWPINPILADPWPIMGRAEWISYQIDAVICHGDAMAIPADYDANGYPRQLIPIDPRAVQVYLDEGQVFYDVYSDIGVLTLPRSGVWHVKGLTLRNDGLRGIGVVQQFRTNLNLDVSLQHYAIDQFANAGVPSGIVKINLRNVSQKQADDVKNDWMASFANRVPAVLSQLMDYTPISWSPADMAFLEQRRFALSDIAYILNLDPTDLDTTAGLARTYANREQRSYDRLLTSIGPYLVRFEQAFRFLMPRDHRPVFDRTVVLWADSSTRATVQNTQLLNGSITLNEVRDAEGRPLYDDWANAPFGVPPGTAVSGGVPPAEEPNPPEEDPSAPLNPDTPQRGSSSGGGGPVQVPAHTRQPPRRGG
jgi:HK97 family phage portal protein